MERIYNVKTAALFLEVTENTLYGWVKKGKLQNIGGRGKIRFNESDLLNLKRELRDETN